MGFKTSSPMTEIIVSLSVLLVTAVITLVGITINHESAIDNLVEQCRKEKVLPDR